MQPLNDISGRLSAPREGRLTPDDGLVCERMDLGDGLAVCRVSGRPSRAVMLAAPDEAEERVHLQLLSAGACRFLDRQGEHDLSAGAGTRFLSPGRGAAWTVSPGDRLDVLSIDVSGPRVARWFQDEGCDRVDWRDRLSAPSRQDAAALSRLSALMALRMKVPGPRRLGLEAAALGALASCLDDPCAGRAASRDAVMRAWGLVETRDEAIASITTLAEAAGSTPGALRRAWRTRFGFSLTRALFEARMARARLELLETTLPIKQIAWRAGYGYPTSFTHAFQTVYGTPPSRLRGRGQGN